MRNILYKLISKISNSNLLILNCELFSAEDCVYTDGHYETLRARKNHE